MPQMSPISWLILPILFIITYIIFISLNFYSFLYKSSMSERMIKKSLINWKW